MLLLYSFCSTFVYISGDLKLQFFFIFFLPGVFVKKNAYLIGSNCNFTETKMTFRLTQGLYSFILVLATALLTKYFTTLGMDSFYDTLNLPKGTPDNRYFSYAWRGIYVLLFLSFCFILAAPKSQDSSDDAGALFVSQLFLQILWAFSFFYLGQLTASAIVIVLLDIVAALMMHTFFFISKAAFACTVPYLAWLLFATYLNIFVIMLN